MQGHGPGGLGAPVAARCTTFIPHQGLGPEGVMVHAGAPPVAENELTRSGTKWVPVIVAIGIVGCHSPGHAAMPAPAGAVSLVIG